MRAAAWRLIIGLALMHSACGDKAPTHESYTGPRYTAETDHFSIKELPGWEAKRERGSVVFTSVEARTATIAVRAVPRTELGEPQAVLIATEKSLTSLPGARVTNPLTIERADYTVVSFDVSYQPPGQNGARYDRRHVVIIAKDHVFHLAHTARAGELGATAGIFDAVVGSFKEEA